MKKSAFFFLHMQTVFAKKAADQLCGTRAANQPLCFCCIASTTPLLPKYSPVTDMVGNPKNRFYCDAAQIHLWPGNIITSVKKCYK